MTQETAYRVVDFKPGGRGWTAHYVTAEGNHWTRPIIGWLIRDELALNHNGDYVNPPDGTSPYRDVVAAICDDGDAAPATDDPYWYIAVPGDPEPTPESIAERAQQIKAQQRRLAELAAGNLPATT